MGKKIQVEPIEEIKVNITTFVVISWFPYETYLVKGVVHSISEAFAVAKGIDPSAHVAIEVWRGGKNIDDIEIR